MQTVLTGKLASSTKERGLRRPLEDRQKMSILTLKAAPPWSVQVGFFLSSAETEAFDVAMFAAPEMRKVKERGQPSTWERLTNYQLNVTYKEYAPQRTALDCSQCQAFHLQLPDLSTRSTWNPRIWSVPPSFQKSESANIFPKICS